MAAQKERLPYEEFRTRGYQEIITPYFSVKARRNTLKKNRFGIIISTSVIKSAARRNFFRRQAKVVSHTISQKGFDFFIILRPQATLTKKQIFQETLQKAVASLISHI